MKRLLLVEDEDSIATPLSQVLRGENFEVSVARTTAEARRTFEGGFDAVVLDWMLPDGQGLELLRDWRAAGANLPVIMLTARHELIDKVLGLELGADDYVTKPFEPRELIARLRARLRHTAPERGDEGVLLANGPITMDDRAHVVRLAGEDVELTRMEYALLKLFLENLNKVFTRDEILNKVWGFDAYPTTRTVDTHILQLRQKFCPELFETVRGIGYRMTAAKELTKN